MQRWVPYFLLGIVVILSAIFRFTGLNWDNYNHYHPDERYITWVATSIEFTASLNQALKPHETGFNPFYWPPGASSPGVVLEQDESRRFAYGHFPLYLGVITTRLAEKTASYIQPLIPEFGFISQDLFNNAGRNEFRHITVVGRALTAFTDSLSILLVYGLGRRLFGPWVGLLAATFSGLTVMLIQIAHFFTVDPFVTFFVLLTLILLTFMVDVKASQRRRVGFLVLASISLGLSIGSKFNGVLLIFPLAAAVYFQHDWSKKQKSLGFILAMVVVGLAFSVTNPFAILDFTCEVNTSAGIGPFQVPSIFLRSCFLHNIGLQASMVQGVRDVPFVRQYIGTVPFLYYFEMQLKWGMGLIPALVAFVGLGWASWRGASVLLVSWHQRSDRNRRFSNVFANMFSEATFPVTKQELVILSWALPFFVSTSILSVKFMRYLAPMAPVMMIYGAAMLMSIRMGKLKKLIIATTITSALLYSLAFMNIYRQPHPWISSSRWIYQNIDGGSVIVTETWDDTLPDRINVKGNQEQNPEYHVHEVNWLSGIGNLDDLEKLRKNVDSYAEADYAILASNRNYGVIPRLPERYPLSSQFYKMLFNGDLGYEVVHVNTRMPALFGFHLKADSFSWPGLNVPDAVRDYFKDNPGINLGRFDESFTVYDQPLVIILKNKGSLRTEEMLNLFQIPEDTDG